MNVNIEFQSDEQRIRPESSEVERLCCNNAKICAQTDWRPAYTLERGLAETIEWLQAHMNSYKPASTWCRMSYRIPLFDLNFDAAEEEAALAAIRSRWISTGPRTAEFERRFAEMLGARHAVAVTNCTCALHLAMVLTALGRGMRSSCLH
jgi:hypothetical protein